MRKLFTVLAIILLASCTKDEVVTEQETLQSTDLIASKKMPFVIEGTDRALEQFIRDSFYDLPEYSNTWKGNRYALVIVQGGEQPFVNGEPMYRLGADNWFLYSLQGGKQDRGDELVSTGDYSLYEFKDLSKGEVLVIKNR